jgi:2-methylisocitrate lyase-like PEP mutase family enzyme
MDQTIIMDQVSTDGQGGQKEKIRKFRRRLQTSETFVMPDVWDVASARVMADAGFEFIGTSAVAIGWSLGYRTEDRIPLEELLGFTSLVTRNFAAPVNADLEGASGRSIDDIKHAVATAISAGCVGVTLGDGGRNGSHGILPVDEMTEYVRAMKAATAEAKMPAVITVSTETFLLGSQVHSPFETAIERAEAYFAAGADCVAVPGLQHLQILEKLARVVDGPLAISISFNPAPAIKEFADIGISCITFGGSLLRSLLGQMRLKGEELLAFGHFNHLDKCIPQSQLETLLR